MFNQKIRFCYFSLLFSTPSVKDVPSRLVQCGQGRGCFLMQTSALFGAKFTGFLKFMLCPHGQGRGQFFVILCGRLYGRPLIPSEDS